MKGGECARRKCGSVLCAKNRLACAGTDDALVELKLELPPAAFVGMLPRGCTNLALGKPVSASDPNPVVGELAYLTDGDKDGDEGYEVELAPGAQWIQVDLGRSAEIHAIALWHYHRQKRVYHDVVIRVSDDPAFAQGAVTVFNNDFDDTLKFGRGKDRLYVETRAGKLVLVNGVRGRYVRFYSRGNTSDSGNHYIKAEIYGR